MIECRDGLVRISPYLAEFRSEGTAAISAEELKQALQAHATGKSVAQHAVLVVAPVGGALDDDVRELISLSRALDTGAS